MMTEQQYNSEFEIINQDKFEPPAGSIEKLKENAQSQMRELEVVVETMQGSEEQTIQKEEE